MSNLKQDFPIFKNNPWMIYMDSTATSQKPSFVIDAMKQYLETDYSNIHRWSYSIAENSEKMYKKSKEVVAENIWADSWKEVIYSFNSTYASNLFISSLNRSKYFSAWDKVLVSIVEHHANIVPWLILKEEMWLEVEYIKVKEDFSLDYDDLESKMDSKVKAVSITHVSNVTWEVFDLKKVNKIIEGISEKNGTKKPLFIVDASQSIPHFKVDVKEIWCDAMFFTGHKIMADSGIWVLWGKKELLESLKPAFSWGWAISWVKQDCFKEAPLPDRFEPGTPNLTGAVSLLKAFEYIDTIWWYDTIEKIEEVLINYTVDKFLNTPWVKLIWWLNKKSRVSVFSFSVEWIHSTDIADFMADNNICIRAGQHCAEPFMGELWINHSCRMSLYIYNSSEEVDKFFDVLEEAIKILR